MFVKWNENVREKAIGPNCLLVLIFCSSMLLAWSVLMWITERNQTPSVSKEIIVISPEYWRFSLGEAEKTLSSACANNAPAVERFDCLPKPSSTEKECVQRKCCWTPLETSREERVGSKSIGPPYCYYPPGYPGYNLVSVENTRFGVSASLRRTAPSFYPNDISLLKLDAHFETESRLRIRIYDASKKRYEVPLPVPVPTKKPEKQDYSFAVQNDTQRRFVITVTRKDSGLKILDTSVGSTIFANQFLQISSRLPSRFLYGLGEHRDSLLHSFNWTRYAFWAADQPPKVDANLYGDHPFYMLIEPEEKFAHGVFIMNSNAAEVVLQPTPAITWRLLGGIIDMYVFMGPTPDAVVQQFTEVIGRPKLPPYWALGFHLCRYGYMNDSKLAAVIKRNREIGLPYDTQWTDIDAMHSRLDFTYNNVNFSRLPDIVRDLHNNGQHYVPIQDPGISINQTRGNYPPYDDGIKMDIFMKNPNGSVFIGEVWPGRTAFPDFTNPRAPEYWTKQVAMYHKEVPFDGLWTDMNEPSNFIDGSIDGCSKSSLDEPPYVPHLVGPTLYKNTVCPSAQHYLSSHYDLHNMYGHFKTISTHKALVSVRKKRSFVLSRSTFAGTGRYGYHWTGDNKSLWTHLYYSIPAMLTNHMSGIGLVGSDICGFDWNTTEELCTRWMQLGAFYLFARNHNSIGQAEQDPAVWSEPAQAAMKKAMMVRYNLLPYLYTLLYRASIQGSTVARPLFFEFSQDIMTYDIDRQFMWGSVLLVSPVLTNGARSVKAYIPAGVWYDYYSGERVPTPGMHHTLDAPLDTINLHVRGGYILPTQQPRSAGPRMPVTTTESRKNPFGLLVALGENGTAEGELFWDDGDSIDTEQNGKYSLIHFTANVSSVSTVPIKSGYKDKSFQLSHVTVGGIASAPTTVLVNNEQKQFTYDIKFKILRIEDIGLTMLEKIYISWE